MILTALAVLLVMAAYFVGVRETIDKGTTATVNVWLLLLSLIAGFAAFIWSIVDAAKSEKKYLGRRIAFTLFIPVIGVFSLFASSYLFIGGPAATDTVATATQQVNAVTQDAEIVAILKSVGAKGDYSDLNINWTTGDMTEACGWAQATGCYKGNGSTKTLTLRKGNYNAEQLKTIVAHEYLHYVWYKHSLDQDTKLTSLLIDFYAKNPPFQNRVSSHYVDSGGLKPTEFFSYGCTEIQDQRLGSYIASKCNEYIDTSTLTAQY